MLETSQIKVLLVVNYDAYLSVLASEEGVVIASLVPLTPTRAAWLVHLPAEAKRTKRSLGRLYYTINLCKGQSWTC
jgi:hypothetical protein